MCLVEQLRYLCKRSSSSEKVHKETLIIVAKLNSALAGVVAFFHLAAVVFDIWWGDVSLNVRLMRYLRGS